MIGDNESGRIAVGFNIPAMVPLVFTIVECRCTYLILAEVTNYVSVVLNYHYIVILYIIAIVLGLCTCTYNFI